MPKPAHPCGRGSLSPRIAIVDDDELMRRSLEGVLQAVGYRAQTFAGARALLGGQPGAFDLILSDLQMPGMSGFELQMTIAIIQPALPFVLMSAFPDERLKQHALSAGARAFVAKPFDVDELVTLIELLVGVPAARQ